MRPVCLAAMVLASLMAGCGDKEAQIDETPFREAIVEYLRAGSMDMKPEEFESLEVEGDTATAEVRMATKDEIGYGLKPKWTFTFRKQGSTWKATTHDPGS